MLGLIVALDVSKLVRLKTLLKRLQNIASDILPCFVFYFNLSILSMTYTPEQIEALAAEKLLSMSAVFKRSGVAPTTLWHAKNGRTKLRPLTVAKLVTAINELAA